MTDELWNEIQEDIKNIDIYISIEINGNYYHQLYCKYNYLNPAIVQELPPYHYQSDGSEGDYSHELFVLQGVLRMYLAENTENPDFTDQKSTENERIIFISHKSDDKKYGHALRDFITNLGVKNNQLIYTSHPMNKIPMDRNIYQYLRENIHSEIFMIILWSNQYLESPACLNEMGALWVTQADYTNIYVPTFSFGNPKYHQCAVDTNKMGAVLNGDEHCKASMLELKDKIVSMFNLDIEEKEVMYLLDTFITRIKEINQNGET